MILQPLRLLRREEFAKLSFVFQVDTLGALSAAVMIVSRYPFPTENVIAV
jgi:hypothetical protein